LRYERDDCTIFFTLDEIPDALRLKGVLSTGGNSPSVKFEIWYLLKIYTAAYFHLTFPKEMEVPVFLQSA
jgi:hypothetical protein